MELNELKAIIASNLLGGAVRGSALSPKNVLGPSDLEIGKAVETAEKIWLAVLEKERER